MPKPLAEIVLEDKLCTLETVDEAAQVSDRKGDPLICVLVRELGLDEVTLVAALRRHVRVPTADPASAAADPDAIRALSREVCRRLRVMPLSVAAYDAGPRILRLAMADPTDAVALAEVEHHSGCRVEPVLMTLSAVEEMVEKSYGAFVTDVMTRDPGAEVETEKNPALGAGQPTTVPFRRVSEDAELALRLDAVVGLLIDKGVLSEDEYEEQVRRLMKEREDGR